MRTSKEIVAIIKNRRKELKLSQRELSKRVGISNSTLSRYEKEEREFPINDIGKFATALSVDLNYLLGVEKSAIFSPHPETLKHKPKGVKIPVLGTITAGVPIESIEDIIDYEEITEEMASKGHYFALKIKGNSMKPKFDRGDVVIVRQQTDANTGEIVIVIVNGYDATCKKLKKLDNGIMLISTNPDYEPMFYSNEDIETLPVKILGKVEELRAKF